MFRLYGSNSSDALGHQIAVKRQTDGKSADQESLALKILVGTVPGPPCLGEIRPRGNGNKNLPESDPERFWTGMKGGCAPRLLGEHE